MSNFEQQVVNAINNISMQVEGLSTTDIGSDLLILGEGSPFDSFAMLLLLVELEQSLDSELLAGRSLVEWISSFDFSNTRQMTLKQFSEYLFNDFLKV